MNYEELRQKLELEIANNPNDEELLNKLACVMIENRELEEALDVLEKIAQGKPSFKTLNNLGYFYLNIGEKYNDKWKYNVEEAINTLEKAIQLDPIYHFTYSLLGEAYLKNGDNILAEDILRKAVNHQSTMQNTNNLGVALFRLGKFEEAADSFLAAHNLKSSDNYTWYPYLNYGVALCMLGDLDKARVVAQCMVEKLDIDELEDVDSFDVGQLLYSCGMYEEAIELFEDAFNWMVVYPKDFGMYIRSLTKLSLTEEAKSLFTRIIEDKQEEIIEINSDDDILDENKKIQTDKLNMHILEIGRIYNNLDDDIDESFEYKPFTETECYLLGCIKHNNPW